MSTVGTVPAALIKNSIFKTKIASIFERMRVYSPITTVIRAKIKTIDVPTLSVSSANNHGLESKTSIGTATPGNETITINNKSDMSVDYDEADFFGDKVGFKALIEEQIMGNITMKVNQNFATSVLAGATPVAGTVDLSTNTAVSAFITDVALIATRSKFLWKPRVEGGTVIRAKHQGKGFVMAGSTAYAKILNAYQQYKLIATGSGNGVEGFFMTDSGVVVIDAQDQLGDANQMVYGIAGAPVHAYREDKIEQFDDKIVTRTTAGANSGDLVSADDVIQRNWNMGGAIWNNATVPTTVAAHVNKQLAAA